MSGFLQLFVLFCGFLFIVIVFYFLRKRKISERNSMLWILGSFIVLTLSSFPKSLDILAQKVGVSYPPSLLFLLSLFILLFITLSQSIQISILNERLKELTQQVAINKFIESKGKSASGEIFPIVSSELFSAATNELDPDVPRQFTDEISNDFSPEESNKEGK